MNSYRIDFKDMPWDTPAAGVRSRAHEQSGRRLRLAEFTREFEERQWCTNGHIGYVLEGRMEIDFDDGVIALAEGDGLFIPPGEPHRHKARVLTDRVRVILVEDI